MLHNVKHTIVPLPLEPVAANLVIISPGTRAHLLLPERLPATDRVTQHVHLEDVPSLENYLAKMVITGASLAIYINTAKRLVTAILDHAADHGNPNFNVHVAKLELVFSDRFGPLAAVLGKQLTQEQFLNFLDEWGFIFQEYSLLKETVADFRSKSITRVTKVINQRNGSGKLVVSTDEHADEEVNLPPAQVTATVAIFPGQGLTELPVQIRYRPNQGAVGFIMIVPGLQTLINDAIIAIEDRLVQWLNRRHEVNEAANWDKALIVRGEAVTLKQSMPAQVIELDGKELPASLTLDAGRSENVFVPEDTKPAAE